MATYTIDKIEYNGDTYKLQDSGGLQLIGGNVTGPVNFGDNVDVDSATIGDLVVTGNGTVTNNLQVNTINGSPVGNNPAFSGIPFGVVESYDSTTKVYSATVDGISELKAGTCVLLKNDGVNNSVSGFTIDINNLGAKPVYNNQNNTRDTTIFGKDYTMLFVYDPTKVSGGAWICYRGYDSNTMGYQLRTNSTILKTYDKSRYYRIFFTSADGTHWVPANTGTDNSATSQKTVNQRPINPFGRIVCTTATTNYAAEADIAATTIWDQYNLNLGYSFNTTGATLTLTSKNPVYIKCTPQSNGSAIIDSTIPFTQALPASEDGKIYIFLGIATSATNVELTINHPVYMYKNGKIIRYTGNENNQDTLLDIGGRNLLVNTEKRILYNESNTTLEVEYNLSLYAQNENVFHIQDEIYTISFDYTVSNATGMMYIKINNLNGNILDTNNRYENLINQNISSGKTIYKRTIKITQAQANSAIASFKIVFDNLASNSTITIQNVKLEYGNIVTDYTPSPEELGWEPQVIAPNGEKIQYQGEEVNLNILNKPNVYLEQFKRAGGTSGNSNRNGWQGMDVYGNYLFRSKVGGVVYVYDLTENTQDLTILGSFRLGSYRASAGTMYGIEFSTSNHAGVLSFTDYTIPGDEFPLLLVSDGSGVDTGDNTQVDAKGYCYIQRIQRTNDPSNPFTSTLLTIIELQFVMASPLNPWDSTYFFYPWCQWHYYDNHIYSFGHYRRGAGGTTKKFNEHILTRWQPSIASLLPQGNASTPKYQLFSQNQIDNQWRIEYTQQFMQGCRFYNDKIIATFGHPGKGFPNYVIIFSISSSTVLSIIDLTTTVISAKTMEGCFVYNNKIYLGFTGINDTDSNLYSLTLVKNESNEVASPLAPATTSSNGLMTAQDKIALNTVYSNYLLNPQLQPPTGLPVDPSLSIFRSMAVFGDSYASGSFYWTDNSSDGMSNQYERSWGKQIGRHYGINVMNYSRGGWTAKDFMYAPTQQQDPDGYNLSNGRGWAKFNRDLTSATDSEIHRRDLYILAFGINDFRIINDANSDYEWTNEENDVSYFNNTTQSNNSKYYLNSPNSFFGVYNKIIRHILKYSEHSVILLLSYLRPVPVGTYDIDNDYSSNDPRYFKAKNEVNGKLQQIAEQFSSNNVLYIDVNADPFFTSDFYKSDAYKNHHPAVIGYAGMATAIERLISKAMRQHPDKFLSVGRVTNPTNWLQPQS